MTLPSMAQRREALFQRLATLGIATQEQLVRAAQEQTKTRERIGTVLARQGIVRTADSGKQLASQLGWLLTRLEPLQAADAVRQRIPLEMCRTHRIVPIREDPSGHLVAATDDPLTIFAAAWLAQQCGVEVELVLISEADLNALLTQPDRLIPSRVPAKPSAPPAQQPPPPEAKSEPAGASDEPIIKLVDSLLSEAVRLRASDIHIAPLADRVSVRYRVDGVLHDVTSPPKPLQGSITSRIKILAGLNIAEKRLPQDGRLQLTVDGKALDLRISTLPALHGESIVMRLLDRSQPVRGLQELGLPADLQAKWEPLVQRPYGMILVTGPTGSGKTTTLYGTLVFLNRPQRKLITVEDPVEYQLPGVNQVHVKSAIGLTFAAGLRAMLRQAPDIIMVGEIRDQETAQIATQAALTGHLVFSTLHTNDAPSAVTRLIDMGIAPFLVASTVQGVLAQRLVRRICPSCRATRAPTAEEQRFLGEPQAQEVAQGGGCDACHATGYHGRVGLYELLFVSDALRGLIVAKRQASGLKQQAVQEGMRTLRDDGRIKVREGLTTVAEVLRATPEGLE